MARSKETSFIDKVKKVAKRMYGDDFKRIEFPDNQPFVVLVMKSGKDVCMSESEINTHYKFLFTHEKLSSSEKLTLITSDIEKCGIDEYFGVFTRHFADSNPNGKEHTEKSEPNYIHFKNPMDAARAWSEYCDRHECYKCPVYYHPYTKYKPTNEECRFNWVYSNRRVGNDE